MQNKDYFLVATIKSLVLPILFVFVIEEKFAFSYVHLIGASSQIACLISFNVFAFLVANFIQRNSMESMQASYYLKDKIGNPVSLWIQLTFGFFLYMFLLILEIGRRILHLYSLVAIIASLAWRDVINLPNPNHNTETFILLSVLAIFFTYMLSGATREKIELLKNAIIEWSNQVISSLKEKEQGHKFSLQINLSLDKSIPQVSYFVWKVLLVVTRGFINGMILVYNKAHLYRLYLIPRYFLYAIIYITKITSLAVVNTYLAAFRFAGISVQVLSFISFSYFLYKSGYNWVQTYQHGFSIWVFLKTIAYSICGVFLWQLSSLFAWSFKPAQDISKTADDTENQNRAPRALIGLKFESQNK